MFFCFIFLVQNIENLDFPSFVGISSKVWGIPANQKAQCYKDVQIINSPPFFLYRSLKYKTRYIWIKILVIITQIYAKHQHTSLKKGQIQILEIQTKPSVRIFLDLLHKCIRFLTNFYNIPVILQYQIFFHFCLDFLQIFVTLTTDLQKRFRFGRNVGSWFDARTSSSIATRGTRASADSSTWPRPGPNTPSSSRTSSGTRSGKGRFTRLMRIRSALRQNQECF